MKDARISAPATTISSSVVSSSLTRYVAANQAVAATTTNPSKLTARSIR